VKNSNASEMPSLKDLFPFEYKGGGYFRKKGVAKGVTAEILHGDEAVKRLYNEMVKRLQPEEPS